MSAPGTIDALGESHGENYPPSFETPTLPSGTRSDMGSLALMLIANWFINGQPHLRMFLMRFVSQVGAQGKLS